MLRATVNVATARYQQPRPLPRIKTAPRYRVDSRGQLRRYFA